MTTRKTSLFTILAGGFLVLFVTILAKAQTPDDLTGDWLATLDTPMGNLRLQVNVSEDGDGSQTATLESLDQAPGQLIPITSVDISAERFTFEIQAIGAQFTGTWSDDSQSYEGVFIQGMQIPTAFARPGEARMIEIDGLDGRWEGELIRADTQLEFGLNIETDVDGTRATLDSISQAAYGIGVTNLSRDGNTVGFQVPAANVTYEGTLSGDTLTGDWMRPGFETVTVTFERVSNVLEGPNRPQTPQAPFPYQIEEVRIENPQAEGVTLAGTLTLPEGEGPFPGVVLISGSGPQDRDETVWTHHPFAVMADHLTRHGIAVLRYDDRGFAESTGEFGPATSYDFATDTQAVAAFMRAHPSVGPVGLAGHSEGGVIAPIVAVNDPETAFVILLAGPGTPGHQFVVDQTIANMRAMGEDEALIMQRIEALSELIAIAQTSEDTDSALTALDAALPQERMELLMIPNDQKQTFMRSMARDWYRALVNYDPADWIPEMEQPVLVLQGDLDLQIVPEPNVAGLRTLLADHPDAEIVVLEGLNHLFQPAQTGLMTEYAQIETTFDPDAMMVISDWINQRYAQ